ncbi:hypothetical protein ABFS82_04G147600 [Erythranthe guttata]|uniref:zinc finger protein ZAT9-like isoform X1 n=1 Tax=Erythranthe guttata TaxID=4155 RepID=UPI00064DD536|nr:PREDICTED: zinc finger protein ZAT9-like isoform X1 [Erythranthe guttata]|eukprot:XP_012854070.1 PREDICTED: zinc finger protein ZAT9-like isoform X1 [Erythranthe guttata]
MEEDKDQKHICRFCSKSFPCGRSLGGHMRSHLITVPSTDHQKADENTPDKKKKTKKLPPLVNGGIIPIPKKPNKPLNSSEEDTLLREKLCKECGKTFQSWKALFGHMKCHSVNGKTLASSNAMEEYSSNSQSDNNNELEASAKPMLPCKRKRSYRTKRYTTTSNTNSSSVTNTNLSSSISEIEEQEEQEEVALSLIILSRDRGDWRSGNSNSDRSSDFLEPKRVGKELEIKSLPISRNGLESEVNSPKNLIEGGGIFFERERRNKINKARRSLNNNNNVASDFENKSKCFTCSICKKAFSSYQALGGHRASHKKFKGCCAPITGNMFEPENSHSQGGNNNNNSNQNNNNDKVIVSGKSSKEHECPICFKVFSSGQALGGHKRSHLIVNRNPVIEKTRNFLDLNLPAPDEEEEEECNEFKPWWIEPSREQEPLLGLLSS